MANDVEFEHALANQLAIILGYADLLLDDMPAADPHREDVGEIRKAANDAMALLRPSASGVP